MPKGTSSNLISSPFFPPLVGLVYFSPVKCTSYQKPSISVSVMSGKISDEESAPIFIVTVDFVWGWELFPPPPPPPPLEPQDRTKNKRNAPKKRDERKAIFLIDYS